MSKAKKLAVEIVGVLKFNPELSDSDKQLAIETRLDRLIQDVEAACEESHKRTQSNAVIVDNRPQDIPILQEAMLNMQQSRGTLLN